MKTLFLLIVLLMMITFHANAQVTNSWTGKTSTDWNTAANWSTGSVPGSQDNVQLGMAAAVNQPVINGSFTIGSLTMGVNPVTLTITVGNTLTVSGSVTQNHSTNNRVPLTTLTGAGSLSCTTFVVGGNIPSHFIQTATTEVISQLGSLSISGNLIINSVTMDLLSGGVGSNNALFSLQGGTVNLGGQIRIDATMPPYLNSQLTVPPSSVFSIDITSSQNATLLLTDSNAVSISNLQYGYVNFYNPLSGTGISTVKYIGANQNIYNTHRIVDFVYQNLVAGGTGVKTFGKNPGETLNTGGDLTILAGSTLNLQGNTNQLIVHGSFVNRGTLLASNTAGVAFYGSNFMNSGTFTYPVSPVALPVYFVGGTQSITDSTATGLSLQFLMFANSGTKHIHSGSFSIIPNGIVNIIQGATVNVDSAATFTLRADTTGTSSIAPIPQGCSITGQVSVQQFIPGSPGSTAARGYLLTTSPVNLNGAISGERTYGVNYLHGTSLSTGAWVNGPGGPANGFDQGNNVNPTMYLYREDISTCYSTFICGVARGVLKLNYSDPNVIGTSTRFNNTSTPDTMVYMPIANSAEFYFVGNRILSNGTTTGTKYSSPVNYPENVTLTNTGTANQGNVQVRIWFRSDHYLSYTNSPSIANATVSGGITSANQRGYNLVGNPYPAPINLDYWSATNSKSEIYAPNLATFVYEFNGGNNQNEVYQTDSTHNLNQVYAGVGKATNIVNSSTGFFVYVNPSAPNPSAASLLFREGCKQVSQPVDTNGVIIPGAANLLDPLAVRVRSFAAIQPAGSSTFAKTTSSPKISSNTFAFKAAKLTTKPAAKTWPAQLIRLKLYGMDKDSVSDNDEVLIRFKNSAKEKFSPQEDAYDAGGSQYATVMLSSYSSDHVPLAINTLPLPAIRESILLYTDGTISGNYKLRFTQLDNIPLNYLLELKDKQTGTVINIRNVRSYDFKIDKSIPASFGDRFEIIVLHRR